MTYVLSLSLCIIYVYVVSSRIVLLYAVLKYYDTARSMGLSVYAVFMC